MTAQFTVNSRCFGYARVSTGDQDLSLQIDALVRSGIRSEDIFADKISGAKEDRPGLTKCLQTLHPGDTLVVWRLDRLGRSMKHLVGLIENLREKQIGFKSINDGAIDTTSASGELIFNIFSALAQFESRLIQERTKAGLAAARARGKVGGRKRITSDDPRVVLANKLYQDKTVSIDDICATMKISRATPYRYVKLAENETPQTRLSCEQSNHSLPTHQFSNSHNVSRSLANSYLCRGNSPKHPFSRQGNRLTKRPT